MRAMFLEKRSISTLVGADSSGPGARVTGWGVGLGSGGWTPGFCNSGLGEGAMAHLALDILPGWPVQGPPTRRDIGGSGGGSTRVRGFGCVTVMQVTCVSPQS